MIAARLLPSRCHGDQDRWGDLSCDLTKVPGVPRFLANRLKSTAEKFVIGKMSSNLAAVGKAVGQILERRGRATPPAEARAGSSPA